MVTVFYILTLAKLYWRYGRGMVKVLWASTDLLPSLNNVNIFLILHEFDKLWRGISVYIHSV